jgi:hypothetical protein
MLSSPHTLQLLIAVLSCLVAGAALFSIDFQPAAAPIAIVTTTETLAAAGFALSLPSGNGKAVINVSAQVTAGSSTSAIVLKVYRGATVTGAPIGTFTNTIPLASGGPSFNLNAAISDVLQSATQAQYCFSVTQTGATANGSITAASIQTELLSG